MPTTTRTAPEEHRCEMLCDRPEVPAAVIPPAVGEIIVCGQPFPVEAKIHNFLSFPRVSAYFPCCYAGKDRAPRKDPHPFNPAPGLGQMRTRYRPRREVLGQRGNLGLLQKIIRQVVIHHDGCETSLDCFHVLHDERGLSAHFLIDHDGVIFQTLDLVDTAFHAGGVNASSIGIELCNRGKIEDRHRARYERQGREETSASIHGSPYRMWTFTQAQYQALGALGSTLGRIFPNLPPDYPTSDGSSWITTDIERPEQFCGYLGHYHVTRSKWDPGGFDFALLKRMIKARPTWFFATAPGAPRDEAQALIERSEQAPAGGYFPVGPCGPDLVWHGGVHLQQRLGAPILSPFPGRVVAARLAPAEGPTGSRSFVLTRHSFLIRGERVAFYMLFFHVMAETAAPAGSWLERAARDPLWRAALRSGSVGYPEIDVIKGAVLGRVGRAGPPGHLVPQLHLEVMAAEELGQRLQPGHFQPLDCGQGGLVCLDGQIRSLLGGQSPQRFFGAGPAERRTAQLERLRRLAVRSPSEWAATDAGRFSEGMRGSRAFQQLTQKERDALFCHQIEPVAWWTKEVARCTGLPEEAVVWHYHPIEFIGWLNEQLSRQSRPTVAAAGRRGAGTVDDGLLGQEGYVAQDDLAEWDERPLSLQELADGYPPHWLLPRQ